MQILSVSNNSPKSTVSSDNYLNHKTKQTQVKLSMIWVKEFDGERNRLVAKWIKN